MAQNSKPDMTAGDMRLIRKLVVLALMANVVPLVSSAPGIGKSDMAKSIADDANLLLIDVRMSMLNPIDTNGMPGIVDGKAVFLPFNEYFPSEDMELPLNSKGEPYSGWLLFMDELPSAPKAVQLATYKIILDRMVGSRRLNPRVFMMAAGNRMEDNAIVTPMTTAFQSRMLHLTLTADKDIWLEDYAFPKKVHQSITSFVAAYPTLLMNFDPDHDEKTFACPRTWAMLDKIMKAADRKGYAIDDISQAVCGCVGDSVGSQFITFVQNMDKVTKISDIMADPENALIPDDSQYQWATLMSVMANMNKSNVSTLYKYLCRLSLPMRVIALRYMKQDDDLRHTDEFADAVTLLGSIS